MLEKDRQIKELETRLLENEKSLTSERIHWAQIKVSKGYGIGADVIKADETLKKAQTLVESRDFKNARSLAAKAENEAEKAIEQLRYISDRIRDVLPKIERAEKMGADMTTAKKFFEQAKYATQYDSALYFLQQTEKEAVNAIRHNQEIAETVERVLAKINKARSLGGNTESAEEYFDKSKLATQFESAIHFLSRAEEEADKLLKDRV